MTTNEEAEVGPDPARLNGVGLSLAILDVLLQPRFAHRLLPCAINRLWRELEDRVTATFDGIMLSRMEDGWRGAGQGRHGLRAERMRELRRPIPCLPRRGLTISDVAKRVGLGRETTARLLEANGYIETSPFGGQQSRRLVTQAVQSAGHGHNVDPSHKRSPLLDGGARAAPFAVFYEEHVDDIIWSLGWDVITSRCQQERTKKGRLTWLLQEHGYLPEEEIGRLAGYTRDGVRRARKRGTLPCVEALAA